MKLVKRIDKCIKELIDIREKLYRINIDLGIYPGQNLDDMIVRDKYMKEVKDNGREFIEAEYRLEIKALKEEIERLKNKPS